MSFPADKAELSKLRAGDKLTVSGTIYTARDAAHKRLTELIASGEELPLDIRGRSDILCRPHPGEAGAGDRLMRADDLRAHGRLCAGAA